MDVQSAFNGGGSSAFSSGSRRPSLSSAQRRQMLEEATRSNDGLLSDLFWLVDFPGAALRGAAVGDPLSVFGDHDRRVTGEEMLKEYDVLADNDDSYSGFWGGLAAEVLLDPTTYLTGGMSSLTKSGKVAKAAGLLDRAPEYLSKQFLAGNAAPEIAERATKSLQSLGRDTVSAAEVAGRPLVGKRAARRYGTLDDLIQYAPDPQKALADARVAAGGEDVLQGLMGDQLGKAYGFRFGIPGLLKTRSVAFDVPGAGKIADAYDAVGTALRWNPASRMARPLIDKSVDGSTNMEEQILQSGAYITRQDAVSAAAREAGEAQARLLGGGRESAQAIMSEDGNRALGRLIENPADNAFAVDDEMFMQTHPAMRQYLQWWQDTADRYLEESAQAGIGSERFSDPNIQGYLPRSLSSPLEIMGQRNATVGKAISTLTPDQMHRATSMMVPGGRDTIAFELSRDPFLVGNRNASPADKAKHIQEKLGPAVDSKQAKELAELLDRLPAQIMEKAPLFGQHPTEMITNYMKRRSGAMADARTITESLAARAIDTPAFYTTNQPPAVSLADALQRTGLHGGAKTNLRQILGQRFGVAPDAVELSKYSVPESFLNHLTKARDTMSSPEVAKQLTDGLNHYMVMFKSGVLTWPARYVRDLLSGGLSNHLEGALSVRGGRAAYRLMHGGAFDGTFARHLSQMPQYSGLSPEDAVAKFYGDLSATGLIDTAKHIDNDTSGMRAASTMVGLQPDGVASAFGNLARNGAPLGQYVKEMLPLNPFTYSSKLRPTSPTTNRMALLGMQLSEYTDRFNRLSGYIELLMQGLEPIEAAKRIKRVQVDYSSLTTAEKWVRDNLFPFYAYQSRIFQEVMRQIVENRGGTMAQIMRAKVRNDESLAESGDYVPEYLRDQWALPVGEDADGDTTYLSNIDVPGLDALDIIDTRREPGSSVPLNIGGTAKNLAVQSNPLLKTFMENAFERDLFRDMPLERTSVEGLMNMAPYAQRPMTVFNQLTRPTSGEDFQDRALKSLASNLAGVKFTTPEEAQKMRDAYRVLTDGVEPYSEEDKLLRQLLPTRRRQAAAR